MRGKNELWELSGGEGDFLHFYVEEADRFVPSPPKNAKGMSGNPRRKVPKNGQVMSCNLFGTRSAAVGGLFFLLE